MKPMKIAVLGCGTISDAYLSTMTTKFKILDVVACCDLNEEKMNATAEKYNLKAMKLEEILVDTSIEIVVNITPSPAHYPLTKKLLSAGKHVYSEKVMALTLEEGRELVALAEEKCLYLGVAPDTFLGAAMQTAKYVVESGMIGQVTSCYAALTRDVNLFANFAEIVTKPGGGIAFDVGIYYVTALLSILGPVKKVSGLMRTVESNRTYDLVERLNEPLILENETIAAATLEFVDGTVGNMLFDATSVFNFPEQPALVLHGTHGIMTMADPNLFGGDVRVLIKGNAEAFVMPSSHPYGDESRGLGVAEMAWSMTQGRMNRANKAMAYHALEVLHGIGISGETGKHYALTSTCTKPAALPRGYKGGEFFAGIDESALAL